jgi:hypothetical protein
MAEQARLGLGERISGRTPCEADTTRFTLESLRFRYNSLWQQGHKLYPSSRPKAAPLTFRGNWEQIGLRLLNDILGGWRFLLQFFGNGIDGLPIAAFAQEQRNRRGDGARRRSHV